MSLNKSNDGLFFFCTEGATLMCGEVALRMIDLDLVLSALLTDSPETSLALMLYVQ